MVYGNSNSTLAILEIAPNETELLTEKPFQSRGGRIFQTKLKEAGIDLSYTFVLYCEGSDILNMLRVLPQPKVVIAMGLEPLKKFYPSARLNKFEFRIWQHEDYKVAACRSCESIARQSRKDDEMMVAFLEKAKKYADSQ